MQYANESVSLSVVRRRSSVAVVSKRRKRCIQSMAVVVSDRQPMILAEIRLFFAGLRGRFSVCAVQKHRYLRRSQKREVFTAPLSFRNELSSDAHGL